MFTEKDWKRMMDRPPKDDDLERLNCDLAGQDGHKLCGYCPEHDKPRFYCTCKIERKEGEDINYLSTRITF